MVCFAILQFDLIDRYNVLLLRAKIIKIDLSFLIVINTGGAFTLTTTMSMLLYVDECFLTDRQLASATDTHVQYINKCR